MRNKILIACLITLSSCCMRVCQKYHGCERDEFPTIKVKFNNLSQYDRTYVKVKAHESKTGKLLSENEGRYYFKDTLTLLIQGQRGFEISDKYYVITSLNTYDSIYNISYSYISKKLNCDNCNVEITSFKDLSFEHNGQVHPADSVVIKP